MVARPPPPPPQFQIPDYASANKDLSVFKRLGECFLLNLGVKGLCARGHAHLRRMVNNQSNAARKRTHAPVVHHAAAFTRMAQIRPICA